MNTILSVDLDILLSPYIGIYNDYIKGNNSCNIIWEKLKEKFDTTNFIINQQYQILIQDILKKYEQQVNTIYIAFDHSSILTAMQENKSNFNIPYYFTIYNIDFHHDIFYDKKQSDDIKQFNIANCGSWVGFLTYNNFLMQYYWYYGIGSNFNERFLNQENSKAIPSMLKYQFNNDLLIQDLQIDLLFISISPQWIPIEQYHIIRDILLQLPKEKIKFINQPFFYNSEEKEFLSLKTKQSSLKYFVDFFNFL